MQIVLKLQFLNLKFSLRLFNLDPRNWRTLSLFSLKEKDERIKKRKQQREQWGLVGWIKGLDRQDWWEDSMNSSRKLNLNPHLTKKPAA